MQKDDHDNMVKHFSKLEVENIDLQLRVQRLEEKLKKPNNQTPCNVTGINLERIKQPRYSHSSSLEHYSHVKS